MVYDEVFAQLLSLTGATAEAMEAWITAGMAKGEAGELERIFRTNDRGQAVLAAEGYEFERTCCGQGAKRNGRNGFWWCAPPCMPNNRPRGWKHVCPMRRTNWRP